MKTQKKLKQALKLMLTVIVIASLNVPGMAVADSHDGKYIVVLGAPGSGRSTNIKWISEAYGIPWINLREVVYEEVRQEAQKLNRRTATITASHKRGGYTQHRNRNTKNALERLIAGELVTDDSLNAFVASQIFSSKAAKGFILDSYPVTIDQATFLDSLLDARGIEGLQVIFLDVSDEVALERLKARGKAEFKRSFASERITAFRSIAAAVVYYYGDSLQTIDANMEPSAVTAAIATALEK